MIGIIVLNYNTWKESIKCINSIEEYTKTDYRIYLVDNNSPRQPDTLEKNELEKKDNVVIIYNDDNKGYAAGNNIGLERAYKDNCEQFLICNSDIVFVDDSISVLSEFGRTENDIGVVGPLVYNIHGELDPIYMLSKLTFSGKIKNMLLSTRLKYCFRRFEKSFVRKGSIDSPLKVWSVHGCCFLITKKGYEQCFPFDEHTFLYEEEYILGCRLEEESLKAYVIPNTYVIHAHGKSTGGITPFSYNCLVESEQYYLKQYIGSGPLALALLKALRKVNWVVRYRYKK